IDLDHREIHKTVLDLISGDVAEEHTIVPFAQPMKFLDVAMADPTNLGVIDELRTRTQLNIRPYLAGPKMIERAIGKFYGRGFGRHAARPDRRVPLEADDVRKRVQPPPSVPVAAPAKRAPETELFGGPPPLATRDAEIDALQDRISKLEALVARDEEVLRKL